MNSAWFARRQSSKPVVCATQAVSIRCQGSVLSAIALPDPMEEFDAAFLPNRPEQLFLRLEIIVDRGRLHFGRGSDVTHRGAVEALFVEKGFRRGNDPGLGLLSLARSGFVAGHPFVAFGIF